MAQYCEVCGSKFIFGKCPSPQKHQVSGKNRESAQKTGKANKGKKRATPFFGKNAKKKK